ncbi:MAG: response regulator [Deltaproteobacteria bacterium]|nr:response regulator [Deltaproteobacteria bacterium]
MSQPLLLLVDDSEAALAFAQAALAGHYEIALAHDGREALERVRALKPAAVLLDLSMPEMDGDEVLARMQADGELKRIPVVIVSTERARAEACVRSGARAFLAKPVRANELASVVDRVLQDARREALQGSLAALCVEAGGITVALPLDSVHSVIPQPATRAMPLGPSYLNELVDLHGEPVLVLDLARRLGADHARPLAERLLVVVTHEERRLALCVDTVRDPEELPPGAWVPRDLLGGAEHGQLDEALRGLLRMPQGPVPVIEPRALVSRALLVQLADGLRGLREGT